MTDGASGAYFERVGPSAFQPTAHVGGGWDPDELHFSPLGGLLVHAIEQHLGPQAPSMVLGRVSFDILGRLAADVCDIRVETIRPGRTIQLVEATLAIGGRDVISARAWYLAAYDTAAVVGGAPSSILAPSDAQPWNMTELWPGGYVASLEVRQRQGALPGAKTAWVRSSVALVAGDDVSDVANYVALVDTANGIAVRESPAEWMFPNVDLTVHLYRQPTGPWVGFETAVIFGPTGQGVTDSILHDVAGPVGRVQQLLTVRPMRALQ
jgi:hypothetical protein